MDWDVFISYAGEDRDSLVEPLAAALGAAGLKVWYAPFVLRLGDNLRQKIDEGLRESSHGGVVLSPHFFERGWPKWELDGLVQRQVDGEGDAWADFLSWTDAKLDELAHKVVKLQSPAGTPSVSLLILLDRRLHCPFEELQEIDMEERGWLVSDGVGERDSAFPGNHMIASLLQRAGAATLLRSASLRARTDCHRCCLPTSTWLQVQTEGAAVSLIASIPQKRRPRTSLPSSGRCASTGGCPDRDSR